MLIGPQSQLHDFLFGVDRNTLIKAKPVLVELQSNRCFYCQKPMKGEIEVDHFIPFARYSHDLGHNFVAAHSVCNNSKRDFLAAQLHRERWQEQNLVIHERSLSEALSPYFYCDADKSQAVSDWAYQVACVNGAKLWLSRDRFEEAKPVSKPSSLTQIATLEVRAQDISYHQEVDISVADSITQLPYFPHLKMACGHFKTGDDSNVEYIGVQDNVGRFSPSNHFLARASGNSMNGGKNAIYDGDLLLFEWIAADKAGSLQGATVAIECDGYGDESQYLLRNVEKIAEGRYLLIANNSEYSALESDESMRTFARLVRRIDK